MLIYIISILFQKIKKFFIFCIYIFKYKKFVFSKKLNINKIIFK